MRIGEDGAVMGRMGASGPCNASVACLSDGRGRSLEWKVRQRKYNMKSERLHALMNGAGRLIDFSIGLAALFEKPRTIVRHNSQILLQNTWDKLPAHEAPTRSSQGFPI